MTETLAATEGAPPTTEPEQRVTALELFFDLVFVFAITQVTGFIVAFRLRNVHTLNTARLTVAVVLLALIPLATAVPALAAMAIVAALMVALLAYEFIHFHEARERLRHSLG